MKAHDPGVRVLPDDLVDVTLCETPLEAVDGASALAVQTDWPAYREVDPDRVVAAMRSAIIVDPNGFLLDGLGEVPGVRYVRVGSRRA